MGCGVEFWFLCFSNDLLEIVLTSKATTAACLLTSSYWSFSPILIWFAWHLLRTWLGLGWRQLISMKAVDFLWRKKGLCKADNFTWISPRNKMKDKDSEHNTKLEGGTKPKLRVQKEVPREDGWMRAIYKSRKKREGHLHPRDLCEEEKSRGKKHRRTSGAEVLSWVSNSGIQNGEDWVPGHYYSSNLQIHSESWSPQCLFSFFYHVHMRMENLVLGVFFF